MPLRLGTRNSALARWQADWVAAQLRVFGSEVSIVPVTTHGDRRQEPIGSIGGEGLFTKEIERELIDGRIDLAVHSLKDLPTAQIPDLCLAAVPERESAADVLVCRDAAATLDDLPKEAVVGTSSIRRKAQLLMARPDLCVKDIRGNVDTRLRKLDQGEYDALILAEAGLRRLGLADRVTQRLPFSQFLPAIGQGALGIETRSEDAETRVQVVLLDHHATHLAVVAERAMLAVLQGGCLAPIAGWGHVEENRLCLAGRVISHDGAKVVEASMTDSLENSLSNQQADFIVASSLGRQVADALLAQDAASLIRAARCD
jgi:hydroxymethylbilane synthase